VVTADLTKLSITNSVPIEITCPTYGEEVTVIDGKNQFMMISLQQVITESYKVNIIQKGETAQDYIVGEATASPNIIQVTGPKARVDRIAQVVAEVNVYGMQKSDELNAVPKALDADGNEIDTSNLTFSVEQVKVSIKIYKKKTIHLLIVRRVNRLTDM
jgi:YbbR domain-containing protein